MHPYNLPPLAQPISLARLAIYLAIVFVGWAAALTALLLTVHAFRWLLGVPD